MLDLPQYLYFCVFFVFVVFVVVVVNVSFWGFEKQSFSFCCKLWARGMNEETSRKEVHWSSESPFSLDIFFEGERRKGRANKV